MSLHKAVKQLLSQLRESVRTSDGALFYDSEYYRHGVVQYYMFFKSPEVCENHTSQQLAKVGTWLVEQHYSQFIR